jgi:hypothetical protein
VIGAAINLARRTALAGRHGHVAGSRAERPHAASPPTEIPSR